MADQIVLAWTVDVTNSVFGPSAAAAALGAVELYEDEQTDPVLGQMFGLTVADDETTEGATTATRTLTLNMNAASGDPTAPPPFPCHPRTSTPPLLPYPLREAVTLPGSFFVSTSSMSVATSVSQIPSLNVGDSIQFLNQKGVFYEVASVGASTVGLTAAYTGVAGNTGAFKEIAAPVAFDRLAVFSTSDYDTNGVATAPAIPAGSGARVVELIYNDSTGAGPFSAEADLTGKRPAAFVFEDPPGADVAEIVNLNIDDSGDFENSVGEITLVALSSALPAIPAGIPVGTGIGATETTIGKVGAPVPRTFKTMTDEAQLLIDRHLAYLPPSYFALAQQGASAPQLAGDFFVTTGSTEVPTSEDQTAALSSGDIIRFAHQPSVPYTVDEVTAKILKLTTIYTGIDDNDTGANQIGTDADAGTKGNIGATVSKKRTGAMSPVTVSAPTNAQLSGPLAQFVATGTAAPPPVFPLPPATIPVPTFLSGLFTRQLQLALAGVPVVPSAITFV